MTNGLGVEITQELLESNQPLFQYNGKITNVNIDSALAAILDKFDTNYIMDAIQFSLDHKFRLYDQPMPNMVYGYEQQFVKLSDGFSSNIGDIAETRLSTYVDIINILCQKHNLEFMQSDDLDYYSAAYHLYQFLVSDFTDNIKNFFTNFLVREKDGLYLSLELAQFKKNDLAMAYSSKMFASEKLALIHGNIGYVMENIQSFDIDLYSVLDLIYANKDISRFLYNIVSDRGNFFYDFLMRYVLDPMTGPELQTAIKLNLQTCANQIVDIN